MTGIGCDGAERSTAVRSLPRFAALRLRVAGFFTDFVVVFVFDNAFGCAGMSMRGMFIGCAETETFQVSAIGKIIGKTFT